MSTDSTCLSCMRARVREKDREREVWVKVKGVGLMVQGGCRVQTLNPRSKTPQTALSQIIQNAQPETLNPKP